MYVPQIIEDSPEIVDDVFDLILSLVESFLEVSPRAEVPLSTASQDAGAQTRLLVDLLNGGVELNQGWPTCARRSTERAFFFLGLSSSSLATLANCPE